MEFQHPLKDTGTVLLNFEIVVLIITILLIFLLYILDQVSSTFWVRGPIYIFHIILRAAVIADYKIIMDILNIITWAWAARQVT